MVKSPVADALEYSPLKIQRNLSRWLVFESWDVLHRISQIEWNHAWNQFGGDGVTVCGEKGYLQIPQVFSRHFLNRCEDCCRLLGLPKGRGTPYNRLQGSDKRK